MLRFFYLDQGPPPTPRLTASTVELTKMRSLWSGVQISPIGMSWCPSGRQLMPVPLPPRPSDATEEPPLPRFRPSRCGPTR
jgi:hypothetical protein